jgi:hypothetical protein
MGRILVSNVALFLRSGKLLTRRGEAHRGEHRQAAETDAKVLKKGTTRRATEKI